MVIEPSLDTEQLRALGSEVRLRIFHQLKKPSTAAELASRLGMQEKSLYYHLRALAKVGLIYECGVRHAAKKPQAIFQAAMRAVRIQPDLAQAEHRRIAVKNTSALLRTVAREFEAAIETEPDHARELGFILRRTIKLNSEQSQWLRTQIVTLLDQVVESDNGVETTLTTLLVPHVG
jgi:DNA-binding transcriptional ArsR family regulator